MMNDAARITLGLEGEPVGRNVDELGRIFTHDIRAAGVEYGTPAALEGPGTARCLIMVTPDAERTMSTMVRSRTWSGERFTAT